MVVAHLVEQSLAILEVCSSNPVIAKIYIEQLFSINCIEKTQIKKKEAGNGPFKKEFGSLFRRFLLDRFYINKNDDNWILTVDLECHKKLVCQFRHKTTYSYCCFIIIKFSVENVNA